MSDYTVTCTCLNEHMSLSWTLDPGRVLESSPDLSREAWEYAMASTADGAYNLLASETHARCLTIMALRFGEGNESALPAGFCAFFTVADGAYHAALAAATHGCLQQKYSSMGMWLGAGTPAAILATMRGMVRAEVADFVRDTGVTADMCVYACKAPGSDICFRMSHCFFPHYTNEPLEERLLARYTLTAPEIVSLVEGEDCLGVC